MTERRKGAERRLLKHRKGRRATDAEPQTPTVRQELERLADAARAQGRLKIEAVCLLAVSRIDELEAVILAAKTGRLLAGRNAGETRNERLTPERRQEIGRDAAKKRWSRAS